MANPVTRGLVLEPEQSAWSSYRSYALGERRSWNWLSGPKADESADVE